VIKKQQAYLYQLSKTAMQSGGCKTKQWIVEFRLRPHQFIEPIMSWTGCNDMQSQVKLVFNNLEQAQIYLNKHGIQATVLPNHKRRIVPKNYSDNFKYTSVAHT